MSAGTVLTPGLHPLPDAWLEGIELTVSRGSASDGWASVRLGFGHSLRSRFMRPCSHRCSLTDPIEFRARARSTGPTMDACCAERAAAPGFERRLARSFKSAVSTRQLSAPSPRAQGWGRVRSIAMCSRSTNFSCSNSPIYKKRPGSTFVARTPEPSRPVNASKYSSRANTNSSRGIPISP